MVVQFHAKLVGTVKKKKSKNLMSLENCSVTFAGNLSSYLPGIECLSNLAST
jgi:hypothetical protein